MVEKGIQLFVTHSAFRKDMAHVSIKYGRFIYTNLNYSSQALWHEKQKEHL